MEIPLTLLDIHRIAEFRGLRECEVFKEVVQPMVSSNSSLYMIRKNREGACLFLTNKKGCSIHPAKPNICSFYSCSPGPGKRVMKWTAACTEPLQRAKLWEQSVAVMVTKAYIVKNGPGWNENDYGTALRSIFENILVRDTQKLKLARDPEGRPMAMLYDCTQCEKRGAFAKETPVTIEDIRRISARLGMSREDFFKTYIDSETSTRTGGLKLKRDGRCIFFDVETHCGIKEVRPYHCRFTPCPKRTETSATMDALYLGSGTVMEQFRHQVALAVTREYVGAHGAEYERSGMEKALGRIDSLGSTVSELKRFCTEVARFRYVDDTPSTPGI